MKKAAIAAGVLLVLLLAIAATVIGSLLWSARRRLDDQAAWVESELRLRSQRASPLTDLDWPPYRQFLTRLRGNSVEVRTKVPYVASNNELQEILAWRADGCSMKDWAAQGDVGFELRHWPYVFGYPEVEDVPQFVQGAPLVQDLFRGGGFSCSLFRVAAETRLYCGRRHIVEKGLLSPAQLASCVELLDRLETARPTLKDEIEVEYLLRCREILGIYRTGKDPEPAGGAAGGGPSPGVSTAGRDLADLPGGTRRESPDPPLLWLGGEIPFLL